MAATLTEKSAAYEEGLREGRADKSKKPKIELEISPEGEEEEGGPEVEEEMDGDSAKSTNRKRSAKGAKNTKAPMDGGMYGKKPMDGECGCSAKGRKGKSTCDGSCGGMKKDRADSALTPQEYLAACELGIQGRSRSYIRSRLDTAMNLTPSTLRADLKCGKGSISKGEKCSKGAATEAGNKVVNQAGVQAKDKYSFKKQQKAWGSRGAAAFGVGGALLGATSKGGGGIAGALGRGVIGAAAGAVLGKAAGTAEGTLRAAGNRTARAYGRNRANIKKANAAIAAKNPKWKAEYAAAKAKGASNKELMNLSVKQAGEMDKILNRSSTQVWTNENRSFASGARAKRRDSVYAAGFSADLEQLAI